MEEAKTGVKTTKNWPEATQKEGLDGTKMGIKKKSGFRRQQRDA